MLGRVHFASDLNTVIAVLKISHFSFSYNRNAMQIKLYIIKCIFGLVDKVSKLISNRVFTKQIMDYNYFS